MTDIWYEKPKLQDVINLKDSHDKTVLLLHLNKMDAWLERAKWDYDKLKDKANKWDMVFDDVVRLGYVGTAESLKQMKQKLEAIRELYNSYRYNNVDDHLQIKLGNILGAES